MSERYVANFAVFMGTTSIEKILLLIPHRSVDKDIDIHICKPEMKMPFYYRFDIGNDRIRLLKRRRQFDGGQISASKSEKPT